MCSERDIFLDVAGELAHGLAASALWHGDRCNWVGAVPLDHARSPRAIASLGPDLYGGTSGVALFLAEAGTQLDDDGLRDAARGAIRHALDHARRIRPEHRHGLYLGTVGVVYAAARISGQLDSRAVVSGAGELLRDWHADVTRPASADVMSGCAGAILGLLAVAELNDSPWLVAAATRMGEELLVRARTAPAGWSWAQPGQRSMHHLCGFSHGAAGVGLALAELFAATGDDRFGHAAERAFDYERSWLDPDTGVWPDLRGVGHAAGRDVPAPTAGSWCNGAAGIALSRLRAAELLGTEALQRDAELALAACALRCDELLAHAPRDFSLCHGAAGIGDVLLQTAAGTGDRRARLATAIGRHGIDHRGPAAAFLPCGVPHGVTPGLFLGLAGMGMFYLRLSDPLISGVLRVGPGTLTAAPARP